MHRLLRFSMEKSAYLNPVLGYSHGARVAPCCTSCCGRFARSCPAPSTCPTFFLLRLESFEFDDEVREVHSRESILETRWWSLPELSESSELIFLADLAEIVRCATRGEESP